MARIRTIKPEFWKHEDLSALPEPTHMLAGALLNYADDEGYFNANVGLIKAECSPLREPSVSVQDSLNLLVSAGYLQVGTGPDGRRYGRVVTFDDHQRVNRPTPSKIKALHIVWDASTKAHAQLTEDSSPEGNREQGTGKGMELGEPNGSPLSETGVSDPPAGTPADQKPVKPDPALRLAQVTDEATEAYNAICAKPAGLMPKAKAAGRSARQQHVKRVVDLARAICAEEYQSPVITPQFWTDYFTALQADDFHSGRQGGGKGHDGWTPDFEYVTQRKTMLRVYERAGDEA